MKNTIILLAIIFLASCTTAKSYPNNCKPERQRREIKFKGFMTMVGIKANINNM